MFAVVPADVLGRCWMWIADAVDQEGKTCLMPACVRLVGGESLLRTLTAINVVVAVEVDGSASVEAVELVTAKLVFSYRSSEPPSLSLVKQRTSSQVPLPPPQSHSQTSVVKATATVSDEQAILEERTPMPTGLQVAQVQVSGGAVSVVAHERLYHCRRAHRDEDMDLGRPLPLPLPSVKSEM